MGHWRKRTRRTGEEGDRGAVIMEAALSLPIFMFAIFTLLSVIQIAYAQSRMSVALTSATKSLAEYAHIYYATSLDETFKTGGGKSSELFGYLGDFLGNVSTHLGPISEELEEFVAGAGKAASSTSITDILRNLVGEGLVLGLMEKNLGDGGTKSAERFMRKYHIKGLKLLESRVCEDDNHIYFRVEYQIEVIKLLKVDYSFNMSTWAYTDAWSGA